MEVFLERENKTINIKIIKKTKINVILKKLNISLNSIILVKNNEIVLEDELIEDLDKLKILSVVSGG